MRRGRVWALALSLPLVFASTTHAIDFQYTLAARGNKPAQVPYTITFQADGIEKFLDHVDQPLPLMQANAKGGLIEDTDKTFIFPMDPGFTVLAFNVALTEGSGHIDQISIVDNGHALLV